MNPTRDDYRQQHKRRLAWMPWLYFSLKPDQRAWAEAWQAEIQARLTALETVVIGRDCFIAPSARIFAEPGRPVVIGDGCAVAAEVFLHGPVTLGDRVSVNHRSSIDGGAKGVRIGAASRIANGVNIYGFDHATAPDRTVRDQPVISRGIEIGEDVWIGAAAGITDGVRIGNHAVVGMSAVVSRDVPDWAIVAGSPAAIIGDRRKR